MSRQVAALERTTGARLFDRRPDGVRLTPAGRTLLAHAAVVLDEVDAAERELTGLAELSEQSWIASPGSSSDPLLGVWPGLAGRPRISHTARDWRTKLYLVAAGAGITTVPTSLSATVPAGVRLLAVQGGTVERRRMVLARLRHRWSWNWHARCARRPRACNR